MFVVTVVVAVVGDCVLAVLGGSGCRDCSCLGFTNDVIVVVAVWGRSGGRDRKCQFHNTHIENALDLLVFVFHAFVS